MARAIHRYPLSTLCARLVKVSHGLRLTHGQLLDGRLASTAEDVFEHELPDVFYEYVLHGLEDKGGISTSYNQPTVSPVERCYELAKLASWDLSGSSYMG